MQVIRHIVVRGRVQGVGYRAWVVDQANAYGLEGWVRNRSHGAVEITLAGNAETVNAMIERCWHGPTPARVEKVENTAGMPVDLKLRRTRDRFSVLPTL